MSQRTRFAEDLVIDEKYALTDPQKELLDRRMHNFMHTVAIDDFNIPPEAIESNTEPNTTHHQHKSTRSNYCETCVQIAQDSLR